MVTVPTPGDMWPCFSLPCQCRAQSYLPVNTTSDTDVDQFLNNNLVYSSGFILRTLLAVIIQASPFDGWISQPQLFKAQLSELKTNVLCVNLKLSFDFYYLDEQLLNVNSGKSQKLSKPDVPNARKFLGARRSLIIYAYNL